MAENYAERLLLYFDFIGTSDAVRNWDGPKLEQLIGLLTSIAALNGRPYKYNPKDNGFSIDPAVTTFSDHIVLSVPLENEFTKSKEGGIGELAATFMVTTLNSIAARIAADALEIGLLVRGGLTVGKVYHNGSVVLGEALVEAHELESRTAIYPRIAVSEAVYALPHVDNTRDILTDFDGVRCLDYIHMMFVYRFKVPSWIANMTRQIDGRIAELSQPSDRDKRAKWHWFRARFLEAATKFTAVVKDAPAAL